MLRKGIWVAILFLCGQASFAETCPNVQDIKQSQFHAWKLYDSEEGVLITGKRRADFISQVERFTLAEWVWHNKKLGTVHCYYKDKNGSTLEAFLTQDHYTVKNKSQYWYPVSGLMQCAAESKNCEFEKQQSLELNTQLAEK